MTEISAGLNATLGQGDVYDLFGAGVNDSYRNDTNPNSKWWDGTSSGLELTAISGGGASMTFTGNV